MDDWRFVSRSFTDTQRLGAALASLVEPGTTISLVGDLGSGKTALTTAIAVGLGVPADEVTSPTFMLIQEYEGRIPLYHFDTYRLKDIDEFVDLGPDEYFFGDGVCLVEWGDRVREALPEDFLRIEIDVLSPTKRAFGFEAFGTHSQALLKKLHETLDSPAE